MISLVKCISAVLLKYSERTDFVLQCFKGCFFKSFVILYIQEREKEFDESVGKDGEAAVSINIVIMEVSNL